MGYDIPEDHHQDRPLHLGKGEHGVVDQALCTLPPEHDGSCNGFMRVSCPTAVPLCPHGTRKTLKCHACVTLDIEDLT